MDFKPSKPNGFSNEARFMQWVWDFLTNRLNFHNSDTVRFSVTTRGITAHAVNQGQVIPYRHPFEIYQCPDDPATANDWRKFRVRGGTVFIDWVEKTVTGTDADASPVSILADNSTAKYWFYLDIAADGSTVAIGHGADPITWSSLKIPIGYVDTTTAYAGVVVKQFIRTDVFTCI